MKNGIVVAAALCSGLDDDLSGNAGLSSLVRVLKLRRYCSLQRSSSSLYAGGGGVSLCSGLALAADPGGFATVVDVSSAEVLDVLFVVLCPELLLALCVDGLLRVCSVGICQVFTVLLT